MNLEDLKKQKAQTEQEVEQVKAHIYRLDGALAMINHFIQELELETNPKPQESFHPDHPISKPEEDK